MKIGTRKRATSISLLLVATLGIGSVSAALAAPADGGFTVRASSEGGPENGGYEAYSGLDPRAGTGDGGGQPGGGSEVPEGAYDGNLDAVMYQVYCENPQAVTALAQSEFGPVMAIAEWTDPVSGEYTSFVEGSETGTHTLNLSIPGGTQAMVAALAETPPTMTIEAGACTVQGPSPLALPKSSFPQWGQLFPDYEAEHGGGTGGGGDSGTEPEIEPVDGTFGFTINTALCTNPQLFVEGVARDSVLISPSGAQTPLVSGKNAVNESGQWTIDGGFLGIGAAGWSSDDHVAESNCLTSVDQWENTATTRASFQQSQNLQSVVEPPATVTDMGKMFYFIPGFNQDISGWDTSRVTNMEMMFANATSFNRDISGWNTSSVTSMSGMFQHAMAFNQNLNSWNTSSVRNMGGMFMSAQSFNQSLNSWNTSNVEIMGDMFAYATAFDGDLNGWDTSKVTNMRNMFGGATAYTGRGISGWNTANVETMEMMFSGAELFNGSIGGWNTSKVTSMTQMLMFAKAFTGDISSWNTANVQTMDGMFTGATSFNSAIGNWNVSKVTTMNGMFSNAASFNQDLSSWSTGSVTNMGSMFRDTPAMTADLSGWNVSSVTQYDYWNWNSGMGTTPSWPNSGAGSSGDTF